MKRKVKKLQEPFIQNTSDNDSSTFDSGTKINFQPIGKSGTEIYAGYFSEEYLQKLRGRAGAKIYDEMRRSESQISMLLNAICNPIKSGNWETQPAKDVQNAELHKEFIDFNLKEMIDWETFLHEVLTLLPFGFSIFEVINNVVYNHPKFGTFNGLKALAFRSQKTIERWNVDKTTGELQTVDQWVQGDLTPKSGTYATMDARHLLLFTLQKEGDNYEGISALRPMYGPYFRKNLYLKITALGLEKHALGIPLGTIPAGKQSQTEINKFKEVLSNFTTHESSYLTKPEGWDIEILKSDFNASQVKDIIILENTEMINSVVANFLALGTQSSGGSYSLGTDLSDFFLSGIQNYANLIAGILNRKLIPDLIKLNYGQQSAYPKMKVTNINDKAGLEIANILASLTNSQIIKPDMKLEEYMRKQYSLPPVDSTTTREKPVQTNNFQPKLSETRIKLAESYKKQWNIDKKNIKEIMQKNLNIILENYNKQIKTEWNNTTSLNGKRNIALNLTPKGLNDYQSELQEYMAEIALRSINDAKKETPTASKKNVKLAESIKLAAPRGGFFNALPTNLKNIIKNAAGLIVSTQSNDINKIVSFQFLSSFDTENVDEILNNINSVAKPIIDESSTSKGISVDAAAGNAVSTTINQARLEWFFEPEVLDTIESFTFVNEDPVSPICQELNGTTWAVGDPDIDRYGPPMHINCKSRLEPNEKGDETNPEITRGGTPLSQKALDSINLDECKCNYHLNLIDKNKI